MYTKFLVFKNRNILVWNSIIKSLLNQRIIKYLLKNLLSIQNHYLFEKYDHFPSSGSRNMGVVKYNKNTIFNLWFYVAGGKLFFLNFGNTSMVYKWIILN